MMLESRAARWVIGFMATMTVLIAALVLAVVAQFRIAARTEAGLRATEKAAREAEQAGDQAVHAGNEAEASADQSKRNEDLLTIVLAITGCTIEDTPQDCAQRVATAGQAEGDRRIAEVDCRFRRALAGWPAPEGTTCIP